MTFSILIPTYDYDCTALVDTLCRQARLWQKQQPDERLYEIIVGDDGSPDAALRERNRCINTWPDCRFYEHPENVGRAAIRNRLAEEARYDYLIYIDCDALVTDNDYLRRYAEASALSPVVCGGLVTTPVLPSPRHTLRFRYEHKADRSRNASRRAQRPYARFSTFNFMIRRDILLDIRFDERCTQYGYEDTLLGICLQQRGIPLLHIDNPLVHTGIDTNAQYLQKSETALRTLYGLDETMQTESGVSKASRMLQKWHLLPAMRLFHRLLQGVERANLLSSNPFLWIFSLYKLGYYSSLSSTKKSRSARSNELTG